MHALMRSAAVLLALACLPAGAQEDLDVKPAMRVADAWLLALDAGALTATWEQAAEVFREAMPRVKWETTMESVRAPLGTVLHRKLRSANYARDLPGAPPGEYVVIQYDTQFENRRLSTEVVTPRRERDGSWKVSGYVIR